MHGRGSVPLAVPTVGIVGHGWASSNNPANLILPVLSDKCVNQSGVENQFMVISLPCLNSQRAKLRSKRRLYQLPLATPRKLAR
jgi:hypothetical protein